MEKRKADKSVGGVGGVGLDIYKESKRPGKGFSDYLTIHVLVLTFIPPHSTTQVSFKTINNVILSLCKSVTCNSQVVYCH